MTRSVSPDVATEFQMLLTGYIRYLWIAFAVIFVIAFAAGFFSIQKKQTNGKLKNNIAPVISILFFVSAFIYLSYRTIVIRSDIAEESYICVSAEYMKDGNTDHDVTIYVDGESLFLRIPLQPGQLWPDDNQYPYTGYRRMSGSVWYTRKSHMILKFTPYS